MEICLLLSLFDLDAFTVECVASKTVSQFLHLWEKEVIFKCPVSHSEGSWGGQGPGFPFMTKRLFWSVLVSHSWQRGYFEVFWISFMRKRLFWSVLVSHSWERLFWSVLVSHSWEKVVVFKVYWFPIHEKEVILKCTGFPFMRKGVTLKHTSWERGTLWALLSSTFLQTLPDLVTPLKGHFLSPRSCSVMRSVPSKRLGY